MFKAPPPNLIEHLLQLDEASSLEETPAAQQNAKNIKLNNFIRSPNNAGGERSPIHIRKVSPMMRKKANLINGLCLDHSDDDSGDKKNSLAGENPFDSNCNGGAHEADDKMRNLFFHQEKTERLSQTGETAEFGL